MVAAAFSCSQSAFIICAIAEIEYNEYCIKNEQLFRNFLSVVILLVPRRIKNGGSDTKNNYK
jgi:hypothetical protein